MTHSVKSTETSSISNRVSVSVRPLGNHQYRGSKHTIDRHSERHKGHVPPCRVNDEQGKDVTPFPMEQFEEEDLVKLASVGTSMEVGTVADLLSTEKLVKTKFGHPTAFSTSSFDSVFEEDEFSSFRSVSVDIGPAASQREFRIREEETGDAEQELQLLKKPSTNAVLTIALQESDTIMLYEEEGVITQMGTDEASTIERKNTAYKQLLHVKESSDAFSDRAAQTFNYFTKMKTSQTVPINHQDEETWVTNWQIEDCYKDVTELDDNICSLSESHMSELFTPPQEQQVQQVQLPESEVEVRPSIGGSGDTEYSRDIESVSKPSSEITPERIVVPSFLKYSPSFQMNLFIVDRMINLNLYQKQLAAYKGFPVLDEPTEKHVRQAEDDIFLGLLDEEETAEKSPEIDSDDTILAVKEVIYNFPGKFRFEILWAYSWSQLRSYPVNCLTWNPENQDFIAVGYGDLSTQSPRNGYTCCWCLKNLKYPERIYQCKYGVTALAFSVINPALLAAGMADGTIVIFNIQKQTQETILDNTETSEIPMGAIWHLKWVERLHGIGDEKKEVIISACEDGRICQWMLRKTMECLVLMRLKHTMAAIKKEWKKVETMIAKNSVAYCIAIHPVRDNIYLVGTGEGKIQECSFSNSDQFINTYSGHNAPVYQVVWSQFYCDAFFSCSGDWTVRLWMLNHLANILVIASSPSAVIDLCLYPKLSTVFVCAHPDRLEIWDLHVSVLDPVTVFVPEAEIRFTSVFFTVDGRALVAGDSDGRVTMFLLKEFPQPRENEADILGELIETCLPTKLPEEEEHK